MTVVIQDPVQYAVWVDLPLCDIRPDARFHPDEEIEDLAKSMAVKQLQNIVVCRSEDRYEAIVGVGRVLAARKLGWAKIRADVYEGLSEFQKLEMTFSENEDRKNASPLYQARLLKAMQGSGPEALSQESLAEQIGKTQANVSQYLSLLELSPKILENINAFIKFGIRHFIQLNRLENKDDQWKFAEMAAQKALSSSELGTLIDKHLGKKEAKRAGRPKGDKNVGADGFAFVQKGTTLRIKAACDLAGDLDTFLDKLKAAILTWRETHSPKTAVSAATTDSVIAAARLPKTPDEQAELEAIAAQSSGPGPVYTWIFGPDSQVTKAVKDMSWSDLQVKDGQEGLPKVLEALKKYWLKETKA